MHAKGSRARLTVLASIPCRAVLGLTVLGGKAELAGIRAPEGVQLRSRSMAACCTRCFKAVLPAASRFQACQQTTMAAA